MNFIVKNWRGELPLWKSYWIAGFAGSLVLGVLAAIVVAVISEISGADYDPLAIFATLVATWVLQLLFSIWQSVGVWRSAGRYIADRLAVGKRAVWGRLARAGVLLGVAMILFAFARQGGPQLAATYAIAFRGDPSIPPFTIRVMRSNTEAEITGGFKYGLTDAFERVFETYPSIMTVHLDSIGGRIGEAEKLNKAIRLHRLATYVASRCFSACTLAFIAGRERWLRDGAMLGFHGPELPGLTDFERKQSIRRQRADYLASGVDPTFIDRALAVPSDQLWRPSAAELIAANVVTKVSHGGDFAMSGLGGDLDKQAVAAFLDRDSPLLEPMKNRFKDKYDALVGHYYEGYLAGRTSVDLTKDAAAQMLVAIAAARTEADDDVLVDSGRLLSQEYRALGAVNPEQCYRYASGVGWAGDLAKMLPADLQQKDVEIETRVLATARARPDADPSATTRALANVAQRLREKFGAERLGLLSNTPIPHDKYGEYCAILAAFFDEVTSRPVEEAGGLMRHVLTLRSR